MAPAPRKTTPKAAKPEKKVTRYTYDEIKEPRTPETGHTSLLPGEDLVVTLPIDDGWSKAIEVGKLLDGDKRPVVVDMDPVADPALFWAGKRNRPGVPVLPLRRNEIVPESRIAQIIERARRAAEEKSGAARQGHLFADLEKILRETDRAKRVEFYTHEEGWKKKLIYGDALHVMESPLRGASGGRWQWVFRRRREWPAISEAPPSWGVALQGLLCSMLRWLRLLDPWEASMRGEVAAVASTVGCLHGTMSRVTLGAQLGSRRAAERERSAS